MDWKFWSGLFAHAGARNSCRNGAKTQEQEKEEFAIP